MTVREYFKVTIGQNPTSTWQVINDQCRIIERQIPLADMIEKYGDENVLCANVYQDCITIGEKD